MYVAVVVFFDPAEALDDLLETQIIFSVWMRYNNDSGYIYHEVCDL